MNARLIRQLTADLKRHEGFRRFAYPDPLSELAKKYSSQPWGRKPAREILNLIREPEEKGRPWTVGYGFAVGVTPDHEMSEFMASQKLSEKIPYYAEDLARLINWHRLPFVIQTVLINMIFNMGRHTLAQFKNTLGAFESRDYERAADQMEKSKWYRQTGDRAKELVMRVRTLTIEDEHLVK